jgi:hypothetical protein
MHVPPSPCTLCALKRRAGAALGLSSLAHGPREQAARRASRAKRFGSVAGPHQAEHALCVWAELGFGPETV